MSFCVSFSGITQLAVAARPRARAGCAPRGRRRRACARLRTLLVQPAREADQVLDQLQRDLGMAQRGRPGNRRATAPRTARARASSPRPSAAGSSSTISPKYWPGPLSGEDQLTLPALVARGTPSPGRPGSGRASRSIALADDERLPRQIADLRLAPELLQLLRREAEYARVQCAPSRRALCPV